MTAKELIKTLQDLGEEYLDLKVQHYDEYRYVNIDDIQIMKDKSWDGTEYVFIGII